MGLDIRTVLFDLDGTIYQNLTFNRIYIRNLTAGTPLASWQESLLAYTEEVFAGRRLIMNRAYSTLPLPAPDPESYFAALEGALLPDLSYEELLQQEHCLFLGDAWAVLALLGKTLGLLEGPRLDAVYRMSRRDMSQEGMEGDKKLRDAIIRLGKRCETVLVSNSYEDTAWDLFPLLFFCRKAQRAGKGAQRHGARDPAGTPPIADHRRPCLQRSFPAGPFGCPHPVGKPLSCHPQAPMRWGSSHHRRTCRLSGQAVTAPDSI